MSPKECKGIYRPMPYQMPFFGTSTYTKYASDIDLDIEVLFIVEGETRGPGEYIWKQV